MRAILHTEFTALLARAGVSQTAFARLAGVTTRQVNNRAKAARAEVAARCTSVCRKRFPKQWIQAPWGLKTSPTTYLQTKF
jgi:hypothetical protein